MSIFYSASPVSRLCYLYQVTVFCNKWLHFYQHLCIKFLFGISCSKALPDKVPSCSLDSMENFLVHVCKTRFFNIACRGNKKTHEHLTGARGLASQNPSVVMWNFLGAKLKGLAGDPGDDKAMEVNPQKKSRPERMCISWKHVTADRTPALRVRKQATHRCAHLSLMSLHDTRVTLYTFIFHFTDWLIIRLFISAFPSGTERKGVWTSPTSSSVSPFFAFPQATNLMTKTQKRNQCHILDTPFSLRPSQQIRHQWIHFPWKVKFLDTCQNFPTASTDEMRLLPCS